MHHTPSPRGIREGSHVRVVEELTMTKNSPRPKATTRVGLNTRRVFPKDIFCGFKSEKGKSRKRKQFVLTKTAAMRLRELAEEYEEKHGMNTRTSAAASTQVKAAPKKKKAACKSSARTHDGPATRTQTESDILEIRAGLSCIKQFVAALEALCERMETNSHASHKSTETVSKRPAHMSTDPPNEDMETSGNDGGATLDEPQALSNEATDGGGEEGSGTTESTSSSKRSRISNWLRNVCRRRSSSSLASS